MRVIFEVVGFWVLGVGFEGTFREFGVWLGELSSRERNAAGCVLGRQ